jgi:uncharacterized membrane protein
MTDQRLERWVAQVLRAGVLVAAAVVLAGGICYVIGNGRDAPSLGAFHAEPAEYRELAGIFSSAMHGDCRGVIQLGLVLLIATPVARVALSLAGFAAERDRTYTIVTAIVLVILTVSLLGKI